MDKRISKPKQIRSKKTMENLLNTAQEMLIDSTFEKANIQEIVKRANSSIGSFYSLFKSKNNLLESLLDRYQNWLIDLAKEFNKDKKNLVPTFTGRAELFIDEYIKINKQEIGLLRAMFIYQITRKDSISHFRKEKVQEYENEIFKYFEPCTNEITHPNPLVALGFILDLMDIFIGEKIMFSKFESKTDYQFLKEECLRLFLNYLSVKH